VKDRIDYTVRQIPMGRVLVALSRQGICAILLGDTTAQLAADLHTRFPAAAAADDAGDLGRALDEVEAALGKPGRAAVITPLDLRGTRFQRRVWHALRRLSPGETASYGQVAEWIGAAGSARAVARACRANMLAVAVPCHRVVRADGGLAGYRWGVERKRALLAQEAA
jgi:AraC family transcriptional regulator of adaptative response/methylated-DNA-[protein]-cysteine methyltransferase